jgi:hypothetical protein
MTREHWRQIEDLYHAAQERSPAERVALLECTDPEIRSRVERMLALDSGGQILDRPATDLLDSSIGAMVAAGARPPVLEYGLTVSPDERELLYSATNDASGDDLVMLEFQ